MNWHERIEAARTKGSFTASDIRLASDFVTCACSEQDPRIPRWGNNVPKDGQLSALGYWFYRRVTDGDINAADICLEQIEARAAEIVKGL